MLRANALRAQGHSQFLRIKLVLYNATHIYPVFELFFSQHKQGDELTVASREKHERAFSTQTTMRVFAG